MVVYPIIYKVLLYIQPVVGLGISEASTVSRKKYWVVYGMDPIGELVAVWTEKRYSRTTAAETRRGDLEMMDMRSLSPFRKTLAMTQNSWLFKGFCRGDEILPNYIGIIISHNKY